MFVKQISYSGKNFYDRCPYSYYLVYERGYKGKSNIYMVRGRAVHKMLEYWIQKKKELQDEERLVELVTIKEVINGGIALTEKEQRGLIMNVWDSYRMGRDLLKKEKLSNELKIEYKFRYPLEEGFNITGVIDLYDEEKGIIIDYKTGTTRPDDKQLYLYGYVMRGLAYKVKSCWFVMVDKGEIEKFPFNIGKGNLVLREMVKTVEKINNNEFEPNIRNCRSCTVQDVCDKKVTVNIENVEEVMLSEN
jgi:RecB family exonuclease